MLQRIASLSEPEQNEIATALSPLLENDRQPTQHMLEFFTAVRLLAFHYYFFVVFYFYCPCRKTDDDDDDDDDKYGVRSTSTRDSIQYAVTV